VSAGRTVAAFLAGLLLSGLLLAGRGALAEVPAAEHYLLHCSGCHGADGHGSPPTTPDLHELAWLLDVPGGRAYLARVPGVAQAPIGDGELAALLGWVLLEFSQASVMPPYTAEEIGRLRGRPLRDPLAARPVPTLSSVRQRAD
jgi:hypothetical protein